MPRKKTLIVRRAPQLEALASPVRREIMDHMRSRGPCTVAELAAGLGRKATSIYYHVNQLAQVGLLVAGEPRRVGGRTEAVYGPVAREVRPADPRESSTSARAAERSAGAALRHALREYELALRAAGRAGNDASRAPTLLRRKARLGPAAQREVRRHLAAIERIFERQSETDHGRFFALTTVFVPTLR